MLNTSQAASTAVSQPIGAALGDAYAAGAGWPGAHGQAAGRHASWDSFPPPSAPSQSHYMVPIDQGYQYDRAAQLVSRHQFKTVNRITAP